MNDKNNIFKTARRLKTLWATLFVTALLVTACTGMNQYGRFDVNQQVKGDFESYRVLPEYNYYYSGPDAHPRAIIGIHKDFELVSRFWKPVDLTQDQLEDWLTFDTRSNFFRHRYWGYSMSAPDGRPLGIWYSSQKITSFYMVGSQQVTVVTPSHTPRKHRFGLFADDSED